MPNTLIRLVYRSDALIDTADPAGLTDIFRSANRNNPRFGITGALVATAQKFMQVLEGRRGPVHTLLNTIEADPRHQALQVLGELQFQDRLFPEWVMARADPSRLAPHNLLILIQTGTAAQVAGLLVTMVNAPPVILI